MSPTPADDAAANSGRDGGAAARPAPPDPLLNLWWHWRPRAGTPALDGGTPAAERAAPTGAPGTAAPTEAAGAATPAGAPGAAASTGAPGAPTPADVAALRAYLDAEDTWFRRRHAAAHGLRVAYFSAEFGVAASLPLYAGGLGVLAGDHLKSASDLGVPLVGVGLLYREGYFTQRV